MRALLFFIALSMGFGAGQAARADDPVILKNGREVYASYARITGLDAGDRDLREIFKLNADRFPKAGSPDELSSAVVLGLTEVGGVFCQKALERERPLSFGQRVLFGNVDFNRGPGQFTGFLKEALVERMAQAFWQRSPTAAEKQVLIDIVTNAAKDGAETDDTKKVAQILCTAFASSLEILTK